MLYDFAMHRAALYRHFFLPLCLLGLVAACTPVRPPAPALVTVAGKVSNHQEPAAGIRVSAYPVESPSLAEAAPFVSPPTAADGRFRLELPAGEYYFLARGEGLFSFYGRNPVAVAPPGVTEMNLGLVAEAAPPAAAEPFVATGVTGIVLHDGRPLAGATVYVYTDLGSRLKGMGYVMAGPTGADGAFEAALPAGTYYLLARQRQGSGSVGPLRAGDFIGYHAGNPLSVREGEVARIAIPMFEVPEKVEQMAESLFGATAVHGRILDRSGQPVPGVRAVLYSDPRMLDRPQFVSQPSGADGAYVLSFPFGGTYYPAARDTLGGAPGPGDLYGTYDGSPDHSLRLGTGEAARGIDIVVEQMW